MTFHGKPRADEETLHHVHKNPWVMLIPLFVLAAGAAVAAT
jgi:NADH-quinone oxidoreductase subunit L